MEIANLFADYWDDVEEHDGCVPLLGGALGAGPLVDPANPGGEVRMLVAKGLELTKDQVELLRVALVGEERVLEEREGGAVGGRELAEEKVPSGEEIFEGTSLPRSASISFGGRFQTRLNQSRKMSTAARRDGSLGNSGGSGVRASR